MKIEKRHDCVIAYTDPGVGMPLSALPSIARKAPKGAVMDIHVARLLGAMVVAGLPDDLERLRADAEPEALVRAQRAYAAVSDRMSPEALRWLGVGEQGKSSMALFAATVGVTPEGVRDRSDLTAFPLDADDFRRCALLYDAVPEVRVNLPRARDIHPVWAGLVDQWDDLMEIYRSKDNKALYAVIDEIRKERETQRATVMP